MKEFSTVQAAHQVRCAKSTFLILAKRLGLQPVLKRVERTTGWFWSPEQVEKIRTMPKLQRINESEDW